MKSSSKPKRKIRFGTTFGQHYRKESLNDVEMQLARAAFDRLMKAQAVYGTEIQTSIISVLISLNLHVSVEEEEEFLQILKTSGFVLESGCNVGIDEFLNLLRILKGKRMDAIADEDDKSPLYTALKHLTAGREVTFSTLRNTFNEFDVPALEQENIFPSFLTTTKNGLSLEELIILLEDDCLPDRVFSFLSVGAQCPPHPEVPRLFLSKGATEAKRLFSLLSEKLTSGPSWYLELVIDVDRLKAYCHVLGLNPTCIDEFIAGNDVGRVINFTEFSQLFMLNQLNQIQNRNKSHSSRGSIFRKVQHRSISENAEKRDKADEETSDTIFDMSLMWSLEDSESQVPDECEGSFTLQKRLEAVDVNKNRKRSNFSMVRRGTGLSQRDTSVTTFLTTTPMQPRLYSYTPRETDIRHMSYRVGTISSPIDHTNSFYPAFQDRIDSPLTAESFPDVVSTIVNNNAVFSDTTIQHSDASSLPVNDSFEITNNDVPVKDVDVVPCGPSVKPKCLKNCFISKKKSDERCLSGYWKRDLSRFYKTTMEINQKPHQSSPTNRSKLNKAAEDVLTHLEETANDIPKRFSVPKFHYEPTSYIPYTVVPSPPKKTEREPKAFKRVRQSDLTTDDIPASGRILPPVDQFRLKKGIQNDLPEWLSTPPLWLTSIESHQTELCNASNVIVSPVHLPIMC